LQKFTLKVHLFQLSIFIKIKAMLNQKPFSSKAKSVIFIYKKLIWLLSIVTSSDWLSTNPIIERMYLTFSLQMTVTKILTTKDGVKWSHEHKGESHWQLAYASLKIILNLRSAMPSMHTTSIKVLSVYWTIILTTSTKGVDSSPSSSVGGLFKTVVTHFSTCVWRKLFHEYLKNISCKVSTK